MKVILGILFIAVLSGCVTTPKVYLVGDPIEVSKEDLGKYWSINNDTFSFAAHSLKSVQPKNGYVKVRYLIDSNGNVFEPLVVESVPEGLWDNIGIRAAKMIKYEASESNKLNTPVYYTNEMIFKSGA